MHPFRLLVPAAWLALALDASAQTDGSLLARFNLNREVMSTPAVLANDTLYVGTRRPAFGLAWLYAINSSGTGSVLWTFTDDVDSTPAVAPDGSIVVGCWDGRVYAVWPNGTLKWSYDTGTFVFSSAAIRPDGVVYIGSGDAQLHAINPNGTRQWAVPVGDWIDASPALRSDGLILAGSWDGFLYAFNPDGTEAWAYDAGASILSSPALFDDGSAVIGTRGGVVHAVRWDGAPLWTFTTGDAIEGSAVIGADGAVYIASTDGKLYCLNRDGTQRWAAAIGGASISTPALRADGSVLVGGGDNKLYCFNADGSVRWTYTTNDYVDGAAAVLGNRRIVFGSLDGGLYFLNGTQDDATDATWPVFRGRQLRAGRAPGPTFLAPPADAALAAGAPHTLTASVLATGTLAATWEFNGATLPGSSGTSHALPAAAAAQAGTYRVRATDTTGTAVSGGAVVDVAGAQVRLANLASRAFSGAGAAVQIAGFVVAGTGPRPLLVRASGPTLGGFGVAGTLADPVLSLFRGAELIATNNNWEDAGQGPAVEAAAATLGAFPFPAGSLDSALLVTLEPGVYTAQATGAEGGEGVALVEVYDAGGADAALVNLSCRTQVGSGDAVSIPGLVVSGNRARMVLVRAVGPTLAGFGVPGTLGNPRFDLVRTDVNPQVVVASNDDWGSTQAVDVRRVSVEVGAFPLAEGSRDAAVVVSLEPGNYTVVVSGADGGGGIALIEAYEVERL